MVTVDLERSVTYDLLTEESRRACLQLNREASVLPQHYGKEAFFQIEIPATSKFVRLGYREYVFVSLLDGATTLAGALAESSQVLQQDALSEHEAKQLIDNLLEQGVVRFAGKLERPDVEPEPRHEDNSQLHWLQKINPFWMKFPLTSLLKNPNQILDTILPTVAWCFHPAGLAAMLILIITGVLTAFTYSDELVKSSQGLLVFENWIALILTWVVLKIIHELAHALCCRYHGGQVPESGIVLILFAPMAYVDVTSSWKFRERWKRMAVAAAGMFAELCIASLALLIWLQSDSPEIRHQLMNVMVTASVSTLLFNANPLMRFDGYFLLSDAIKLPNLYESGMNSVKQMSQRLFYGNASGPANVEIRDRSWTVITYGIFALAWKLLICFSLTLAASVMFGGWGILLAVVGLISWIGIPVFNAAKDFVRRFHSRRHQSVRASGVALAFSSLFAGIWFGLPNPFPSHVPCVVDYKNSAKVRANASGFVCEINVQAGQEVKRGDELLRLENRELASRILEAKSELALHRMHERISINEGQMASAQMALEDQESSKTKLKQLLEEQNELTIRAPNDGTVIAADIESLLGTYVQTGDVLLVVGNDQLKEVVFSIATRDGESLPSWQGDSIPLKIGTRKRDDAVIGRIDPRASDRLPHPGLGAQNGGPLAVNQATDDGEMRLAKPRFLAHAQFDEHSAEKYFAGETGIAYLRHRHQSLGTWIWVSGHEWLTQQIELVKEME